MNITARELMDEQAKRLKREREKEYDTNLSDESRQSFRRKPYYMLYGNNLQKRQQEER